MNKRALPPESSNTYEVNLFSGGGQGQEVGQTGQGDAPFVLTPGNAQFTVRSSLSEERMKNLSFS